MTDKNPFIKTTIVEITENESRLLSGLRGLAYGMITLKKHDRSYTRIEATESRLVSEYELLEPVDIPNLVQSNKKIILNSTK